MKWKTHTAIARTIAKRIGLAKEEEKALAEGSIEPDKYPDWTLRISPRGRLYSARVSHHDPDSRTIMKYIWEARACYLHGNYIYAMKNLGRALHYIQDKCVSKGILGLSHDGREADTSYLQIRIDEIEKGLRNAVSSPHYVLQVIRAVSPQRNPEDIMSLACISSAAISMAVISSKYPPEKLVESYDRAKKFYYRRTLPLSIGLAVSILLASVILSSFLMAIGGILLGFLIQRLDLDYYYWKMEARWYDIK